MKCAWIVVLLVACGSEKQEQQSKQEPPPTAQPAQPSVPAPSTTRLALGACAPVNTVFESGPKPARFDPLLLGGTIPTSTIGTPGMSYGGVSARRSVRVPAVTIGQPIVEGDLDKAIIRRYLRRSMPAISYCYERELATKPALAGELKTSFVITAIGAVQDAKASGVDPKVADCVRGVLASIEFPRSKNSGIVKVQYPFKLRPPEQVDVVVDPQPYAPDERNPLRDHEAAVAACLTQPYGVGLVELGDQIEVHGVDAQAAACIANVAKQVKDKASQTCSFAYGTMPVAELPAIDIDTAIRWAGKPVIETSAIQGDAFIAPLAQAIRATPRHPGLVIRGPVVVRAAATTPMKVVSLAVASAYAAGERDAIVLAKDGTLPFSIDLPAVPVPVGSGASWTDDGTSISIVVTADGVTVDGTKLSKADLAAELQKRKFASAAIAGAANVTLQDVLDVAAIAKVPWRAVTP